MTPISEYYIKYATVMILIFGFISGITHVFETLGSYQASSELFYNELCKEEFGSQYTFYKYDASTRAVTCERDTGSKYSIKRNVYVSKSRMLD